MPDYRCFAPVSERNPTEIVLPSEESHHLVRVNRVREGQEIVVFNGRGVEWTCICVEADRRAARLQVRSMTDVPPLPYEITLAQALPKGKTFDLIIRKATEIGAAHIVPLATERAEVRLDEARREAKLGKWEATALEACKQSGNSYLPQISPVQTLTEFLQEAGDYQVKIIASLTPEARLLRHVLEKSPASQPGERIKAVCLVGPEGDFSPEETEAAVAAGFAPVTLGRTVLRCETAAVYALSILSYEMEVAESR